MKPYLISWSPLAEESYLNTLSQILEKWTINEAEDFEAKVESLLGKLKPQEDSEALPRIINIFHLDH